MTAPTGDIMMKRERTDTCRNPGEDITSGCVPDDSPSDRLLGSMLNDGGSIAETLIKDPTRWSGILRDLREESLFRLEPEGVWGVDINPKARWWASIARRFSSPSNRGLTFGNHEFFVDQEGEIIINVPKLFDPNHKQQYDKAVQLSGLKEEKREI
ncbi:MAG: hypothetical protein HY073_01390 [Deltaproteobacteria bacterium]|nr:hypothetical protein [Deltaproteobacteria bacterium]